MLCLSFSTLLLFSALSLTDALPSGNKQRNTPIYPKPTKIRLARAASRTLEPTKSHIRLSNREPQASPQESQADVPGLFSGGLKLVRTDAGEDFFKDEWEYFNREDPTKGSVNYKSREEARQLKLAWVDDEGLFNMKVDDTTTLERGKFRDSIRILTNTPLPERVVVIADIVAMPYGCSVWPAYWTLGKGNEWPAKGEIDILEGVHNSKVNQVTYHTSDGCMLDDSADMASDILSTNCAGGCGATIKGVHAEKSYGEGFNTAGGGVYVYGRTNDAIMVWFFTRSEVPQDITDKKPQPSTWPKPVSVLKNSKCALDKHFIEQVITFDTTLCGQWAGDSNSWAGSGCPKTCEETVMDPENYKNAQWKVKYLSIYEPQD